jgi:transcriptional regulator with XRE-family HTH domain
VPETPVTFGALLRKLRSDAGLTQEELAEAASLSPRSVSDLASIFRLRGLMLSLVSR